jgi:hypothetical protein
MVEACRRRLIDQAIGMLSGKATWSVGRITRLADSAESESVRLRALRGMLTDMISSSKRVGRKPRLVTSKPLDFKGGPASLRRLVL